MKKILIISPHFPPSNLAAVHRSRLFAQHLPAFGWEPVILTVHEKYYEEKYDWNLVKLLPDGLRVEKAKAFPLTRPRLIGDIGLRAFFQLYSRAKQLIKNEKFDFLYIPIPSFYVALLGRMLHASTGIKYGIDYIDPWVHPFPKRVSSYRHKLSELLAKVLEPIAVKKASIITAVAEGYYKGVLESNPHLVASCHFGAMPYGGERSDHEKIKSMKIAPYLFQREQGVITLVYAGAMLPKAYQPLDEVFKGIASNITEFKHVRIHFIGTGSRPTDPTSYNVRYHAEKYRLWNTIVFEHPARIPYLDVLIHLEAADGVFILGSTEPHYTPSKTYQAVLAGKPILAVLHEQSTAVDVIKLTNAGLVCTLNVDTIDNLHNNFIEVFRRYRAFMGKYHPAMIDMQEFEKYGARSVTEKLALLLAKI